MPSLVQPAAADSDSEALDILGINHLRAALFRHLFEHPEGATSGELSQAIGCRYQTLLVHLRALEEAGAVIADPPPPRQGHRVRYSVNGAVFTRAMETAHLFMTALQPNGNLS